MNKDNMNRRTTMLIDKLMRAGYSRREAVNIVDKNKDIGGKK
jgi:hypothetical protein